MYSIVIPCYNEEKGLDTLLDAIVEFPKEHDMEFVLVENGSLDNSRNFFENSIKFNDKRIKKVYVDVNQGYGYGILQGLKVAKGDYVGWLHADLQVRLNELEKFIQYGNTYKQDVPLFMKGLRSKRPFIDSFFTFNMGIFETLLFRKHLYDVMAMPVLFNRKMMDEFKEPPYDFSLDIYAYALAKKLKYNIYREDIELQLREFGDSSWNKGLISRIKQSIKMIKGSMQVRRLLK